MDGAALAPVARSIAESRGPAGSTIIIGLAGGVAAGKSTVAAALARVLIEDHELTTEVVSTDGFLFPNATLAAKGLLDRKGFPESYDIDAVHRFLDDVRDGTRTTVPVYDHHTYDITDEVTSVGRVDVLVFEGVNALRFTERLDLTIYLHAAEPLLQEWFTARALGLREAARHTYSPFFDRWVDAPEDDFRAMAAAAWDLVNRPNLLECIEPLRHHADVVIVKAEGHTIATVEFRREVRRDGGG